MNQMIKNVYTTARKSTIPTQWIHEEQPSSVLCIMLPGKGYTTQRPLFHYATSALRNQGVDILHINYDYSENEAFNSSSHAQQDQWMYEDVNEIVQSFLQEQSYDQVIWFSKSIGTIPMALGWKEGFQTDTTVCGIWLTPLLNEERVCESIQASRVPSLVIIGDQDFVYEQEKLDQLTSEHVQSRVIPGANHGLEIEGNTMVSIDTMKSVIQYIHEVVSKTKKG
ncbi:alpha/beta family hydrolase [Chryseomicrobium palamuruense]|uniref:Alpha/beta family hydrolase n=1 Tax=Chryseomicrobium palamuruense TaxID=682973 RepID=A0ABV8UY37_9BACL